MSLVGGNADDGRGGEGLDGKSFLAELVYRGDGVKPVRKVGGWKMALLISFSSC